MLFLPEYYGIEISPSLPLLSVRRMMYIILFIYVGLNRRRSVLIDGIEIKKLRKEYIFLMGYFILRVISNIYYITTYGQAAKTIGLLIFEQLFLLFAFYMLEPTKDEMLAIIKSVVGAATVLFIIGIFESISSIRFFDALYTVSREMHDMQFVRLGLLRSVTTMHSPALYGNMCMLIFPLILYMYEESREKKYLVSAGLCFGAIIHSGARSDFLFLSVVLLVYLLFVLEGVERKKLFFKNSTTVLAVVILIAFIFSSFNLRLRYYYIGTCKANLNEIGFNFDLDKGAPEDVEGFGNNHYGSTSRIRQFTGLLDVAHKNPLFGLGSGAQKRGQIKYFWHFSNGKDRWITAPAYDVGMVEILCDEGILGFFGICSIICMLIAKIRNSKFHMLVVACYLLSTLSTKNMYDFMMFYIIISLGITHENDSTYNFNKLEAIE